MNLNNLKKTKESIVTSAPSPLGEGWGEVSY